jgi:hypothetical protein
MNLVSRLALTLAATVALPFAAAEARPVPPIDGVVWQLYEGAPEARGSWHRLGARELLVQWTAVDGIAFVPGTGMREADQMPDWPRIGGEPWARSFILGLSGRASEQEARRSLDAMVEEGRRIARLPMPVPVAGWYFPAEVDTYWLDAPQVLPAALARLPRPLWISVYDSENIGAEPFARWIASFMPRDVGIFFQDSVGIHVRSPREARRYADALRRRLGRDRVRLIAEAFRQLPDQSFRPATAAELRPQLSAYRGYSIYLFDGPHYVSDALVGELADPAGVTRRER